jgi:hypothetical protein
LLISPHGIHVDREGNVWVTDCACTARGGGLGAAQPSGGPPKGHQVFKFSPDGQLLMTLGKAGGASAGGTEFFYQPNDVLVTPGGDIFVAEGHGQGVDRVLKFSRDGKLVKTWGKRGTGPGEFDQPHALAMDSQGRLFVGDRTNNRIHSTSTEMTSCTWRTPSRARWLAPAPIGGGVSGLAAPGTARCHGSFPIRRRLHLAPAPPKAWRPTPEA